MVLVLTGSTIVCHCGKTIDLAPERTTTCSECGIPWIMWSDPIIVPVGKHGNEYSQAHRIVSYVEEDSNGLSGYPPIEESDEYGQ